MLYNEFFLEDKSYFDALWQGAPPKKGNEIVLDKSQHGTPVINAFHPETKDLSYFVQYVLNESSEPVGPFEPFAFHNTEAIVLMAIVLSFLSQTGYTMVSVSTSF